MCIPEPIFPNHIDKGEREKLKYTHTPSLSVSSALVLFFMVPPLVLKKIRVRVGRCPVSSRPVTGALSPLATQYFLFMHIGRQQPPCTRVAVAVLYLPPTPGSNMLCSVFGMVNLWV